jgi:hypothetical protein
MVPETFDIKSILAGIFGCAATPACIQTGLKQVQTAPAPPAVSSVIVTMG